jgi:hypothetical protein
MNCPDPMASHRRRRRRRIFTSAAAAAVATAASAGVLYGTGATGGNGGTAAIRIRQLLQEEQYDPKAPPPMLSSDLPRRLRHLYQGGRFGNILFQWASTYAIAKANDMTPCLVENQDRSVPLHMYFEDSSRFPVCEGVHAADARQEPIWDGGYRSAWRFLKQAGHSGTYYERNGHTGEDINLRGFMESASNLADVEDDVVQMFTFREKYRREAEEYIAPIREEGYIPVGIHARRGDKSKQCCQPQYFQSAMANITNTLRQRGDNREIMWLVASQMPDGPHWYEEMKSLGVFPEESTRYIGKHTVADFIALTQTDHIIVTQGTFSFFAAYLGPWQKRKEGAIVIQPSIMKDTSVGLDWTTIDGCDVTGDWWSVEKRSRIMVLHPSSGMQSSSN